MSDSEYESDSESDSDSKSEYELRTLPSKIHFVWVGGPIRAQYLRTIMDVAAVALKSGFEVNLWVDNEMNYIKTSTQEGIDIPNLRIRNVHELEEGMRNAPFTRRETGTKNFGNMSIENESVLKILRQPQIFFASKF